MKPTIVIHTNDKQMLGALVSAHSFRRNSRDPDSLDVRILNASEVPELQERGRTFLRGGHIRAWDPDDLQSFTPLRFAIPDLLGHEGLALVTDPLATSVMLLDCSKLPHWRFKEDLAALWEHRLDYLDWINLEREDRSTIGLLEPEWNDFDRLTERTKLLHNTKRRTQPWKTGMPVDFTLRERRGLMSLAMPIVRIVAPNYTRHPDRNQEAYFYALLAEALDCGSIDRGQVEKEVRLGHVRADSPALIERYRGHLWPAEQAAPRAA